eukprot:scaffold11620_cov119-Isochrysis_galbana.AAC.4
MPGRKRGRKSCQVRPVTSQHALLPSASGSRQRPLPETRTLRPAGRTPTGSRSSRPHPAEGVGELLGRWPQSGRASQAEVVCAEAQQTRRPSVQLRKVVALQGAEHERDDILWIELFCRSRASPHSFAPAGLRIRPGP